MVLKMEEEKRLAIAQAEYDAHVKTQVQYIRTCTTIYMLHYVERNLQHLICQTTMYAAGTLQAVWS